MYNNNNRNRRDNYNGNNRNNRNNRNNDGPFRKRNYQVKSFTKIHKETDVSNYPEILENGKLRVIPLGGVEYIGINTMCVEYGNDMIIIDMGFGFPKDKSNGIDYAIPNYSYVKENLQKLRGVIITHGHMDHIGAIPYVYKELGSPIIFAGKLSSELIREKAREFALEDDLRLQEVTSVTKYNLGVFEISYFRVNHNIPDSMGVIIRTPVGTIVHTGDFKFDLTPYREPVTEFAKIADIGAEGVLLLCSDSTNSCKMGWSDSESSVTPDLTKLVNEAKGRVITVTFSTLITRMAQIVEIAHAAGRKVVMTGRSIESTVRIAKELGLIKVPMEAFVSKEDARYTPDEELLIMATGSQGEENAALNRMVTGNHNDFDIQTGDTVILSSSFIPGNENKINDVIGKLAKKGAIVYHSQMMDVHATGHACSEDHKMLIHLCKPKFLMPVHGDYVALLGQKTTAIKVGMPAENVILTENGTTLDFDANTYQMAGKVDANQVLVDGFMMGDITPEILADRQKLGNEGIVVIVVGSNDIYIVSRGFIEVNENQTHIDAIKSIAKAKIEQGNEQVSQAVSQYIAEKIGRDPIVITVRR
ncbi:MAG: ribonuclease J [bacterium]